MSLSLWIRSAISWRLMRRLVTNAAIDPTHVAGDRQTSDVAYPRAPVEDHGPEHQAPSRTAWLSRFGARTGVAAGLWPK
jgi:hypothetical protein